MIVWERVDSASRSFALAVHSRLYVSSEPIRRFLEQANPIWRLRSRRVGKRLRLVASPFSQALSRLR